MAFSRIRPLTAADREPWERLFRDYIAFYEADVPDDVIDDAFRAMLSGEPGTHACFLAVDEADRPIGLAHILYHRSTWSKTGYMYLEDLFVDPSARAAGVGEALIRKTYEEADRLGADRTYWLTQEHNYRARGLYDKVGSKRPFVIYSREEE